MSGHSYLEQALANTAARVERTSRCTTCGQRHPVAVGHPAPTGDRAIAWALGAAYADPDPVAALTRIVHHMAATGWPHSALDHKPAVDDDTARTALRDVLAAINETAPALRGNAAWQRLYQHPALERARTITTRED